MCIRDSCETYGRNAEGADCDCGKCHQGEMISLLTHAEGNLNTVHTSSTLPFEIVLNSGAVEHVAVDAEAPGYIVDTSGKSTASFAAANGESIENKGAMTLNLTTTEGHPIKSKFQVCEVSRPLWSVGKICDAGCTVTFDSRGARIKHQATGKDLCLFERRRGLYVASLPLSKPTTSQASKEQAGRGFRR